VPQPGPSTSASTWDDPPRTAKIVLIGSASVGASRDHHSRSVARIICLSGLHSCAGKTSLRNRYFRGPKGFSQAYIATIGADFVTKTIELDDNDGGGSGGPSRMSLQLWDTGEESSFSMRSPTQLN
jgi:GTPase SAR1 family protein